MNQDAHDALERIEHEHPEAFEASPDVVQFADGSRLVALPAEPVARLASLRPPLTTSAREAVAELEAERDRLPTGDRKNEICTLLDALAAAHADLDDVLYRIGNHPARAVPARA